MELARWRSLASASGVALGVKIGGVLRGVLPRSLALRASGGGARVLAYKYFCKYAFCEKGETKEAVTLAVRKEDGCAGSWPYTPQSEISV